MLKVQCILASYALGGGAFVMHFSPISRDFSELLFHLENKIPGVSRGSTPREANDKCIMYINMLRIIFTPNTKTVKNFIRGKLNYGH